MRTSASHTCRPAHESFKSLEDIVAHYRANYQERAARELRYFQIQPTLMRAVREAGLARGASQKRLSHQRRIPPQALVKGEHQLQRALVKLKKATDFAEIFDIVEQVMRSIRGLSELAVYDTALRIAAWRHLEPRRVYLHSGTRIGARNLGLNHRARSLQIRECPAALWKLRAHEVEDVLCIYKNAFRYIRRTAQLQSLTPL